MIPAEDKKKYILNSVDNALSLFNLFFDYEELTVNDIAKQLSISRSTAFRFAVTLENRGFLTKTDHATYRLGLNMFSLGMLAYNRMELVSLVHPYLQKLAGRCRSRHVYRQGPGNESAENGNSHGIPPVCSYDGNGKGYSGISVGPDRQRIHKEDRVQTDDTPFRKRCIGIIAFAGYGAGRRLCL